MKYGVICKIKSEAIEHQGSRSIKRNSGKFLDSLEGILTPKEEQIIIQQIQKIQNQKEEKQKL